MTKEVIFSGYEKQGMAIASIILSNAVIIDGYNAVQYQSHGLEARKGTSKAEVIISDEFIYYPRVTKPNMVFALSKDAYNIYKYKLPEGSILITDSTFIKKTNTANHYYIPITRKAEELLNDTIYSSLVALGIFVGITKKIKINSIEEAIASDVTTEGKFKAFALGLKLSKKINNI